MKKNQQKLIILSFLVLLCVLFVPYIKLTAYAEINTYGCWEYEVINESEKTAKITKYTGSSTYINIPSKVNDYTVVQINESVFENNTYINNVIIEEGITNIGKYTFRGCTDLQEITLPSTVVSIGNGAFQNCESLINVNLPEKLKKISKETFAGCSKLETIVIQKNVSDIGTNAFVGCKSLSSINISKENNKFIIQNNMLLNSDGRKLIMVFFYNKPTSIQIPDSVQEIVGGAFYGCDRLVNINIPKKISTIPVNAFEKCTSLKKVTLHNELQTISDFAFKDCTSLTEIANIEYVPNINNGVFYNCTSLKYIKVSEEITSISDYMFYGCRSLENIVMHNKVSVINESAFEGCISLKSINVPTGVTLIDESAFRDCKNLSIIKLPNTLNTLKAYVFAGCSNLKSIELPNSLTTITNNSFMDCTSLNSIYIPTNVSYIGTNVFVGCSGLKNFNVATNNNNFTSEDGVLYSKDKKKIYRYPSARTTKTFTISNSINEIHEGAFENCINLTAINVPATNVDFLSEDGVLYDKNMTRIICYPAGKTNSSFIIKSDVQNINSYAFGGCGFLKEIKVLPKNFEFVGKGVFSGCTNLTKLIISADIDKSKFDTLIEGIDNLLNIEMFLGETTQIVDRFFYGNDKIQSVLIPNGILRIGSNVFANCENLEKVKIPESITSIGDSLFRNCVSIEKIELPDGLTQVVSNVFNGCVSLREVKLPKNLTYISTYAFYNCTALENIVIPSKVNVICAYAFMNCSSLKRIAIPTGVTSITTAVFANCSNLECIVLSPNVNGIAGGAFYNCNKLTIYARVDSYAAKYATSNNVKFEESKIKEEFISLSKDTYAYTGERIQPDVTINFHGIILEKNVDYICHYGENTNIGEGSVVIIPQGAYSYVNVKNFDIKYEIKDIDVVEEFYTYDGKLKLPAVVVKYNDKTLVKGTDYLVTYKNNINAGKATVIVKGIGEYMGEIHKNFTINPKKLLTVNLSKDKYIYDGKSKEPKIIVKDGDKILVNGKDYTLSYNNNIKPGKADAIVKGKGNYSGTVIMTFIIKPSAIKGLKQNAIYSDKYIRMTWKKLQGVDGYEIYRANSKNGKYQKIDSIKKASYKDAKIKAGNKYYYRVKAYKIIDGKKVYGAFSSRIKMITKPNTPSINLKTIAGNKVKLTWNKVNGASRYEIYMKTGSNGKYKKINTVVSGKIIFTKTKLVKGKKYSFKIRAYNKAGKVYSAWSNVKSIKL